MFFKKFKMKHTKIINTVAVSTFGVFLIHANSDTMRCWLWQDVCNNVGVYVNGNIFLHAIVCVLFIFGICKMIDILRRKLFRILGKMKNFS